jgi:hypothetical protein
MTTFSPSFCRRSLTGKPDCQEPGSLARQPALRVSSRVTMRRLLAITITLLLGFALATPLFTVEAAGNLPICCRRNGGHHCAGGMTDGAGPGKTVSTIAPKCPQFPRAIAAPLPPSITPAGGRKDDAPLFARAASAPQTEARYRVSYARSRQKRGPPVLPA